MDEVELIKLCLLNSRETPCVWCPLMFCTYLPIIYIIVYRSAAYVEMECQCTLNGLSESLYVIVVYYFPVYRLSVSCGLFPPF